MATIPIASPTALPTHNSSKTGGNNQLELFSLIWLDATGDAVDNRNTQQKLRSIINHLERFQDASECQKYVEQKSEQDRLVIVVSGRLGSEIVPSIHELRQVSSIYVYCLDKERNERWARKFDKVKAVITDIDELVSRIQADHKIQVKVDEPLSINIFSGGKSTGEVDGEFVFTQVLIDCLLRIQSSEKDKAELISCFTKEYKGNQTELASVYEFQKHYSPDKAVWWYTRESFFYKTLNAALRTQNIHMMFLYRSFIYDISRQLKHHQAQEPLQVYRTQVMSSDELNILKQSSGKLISVKSFFSTTSKKSIALSFFGKCDGSKDLKRVLFEIDADPIKVTTKPFANVDALSDYANESEVLFVPGSIFRLNSVTRSDNHLWIIQMALYGDDEHALKKVLMHMKKQNGSGHTNLRTLGKILWRMGNLNLAEQYYMRLLEELPPKDPSLSSLYAELADITSQKGDFNVSMQWQQKLIECKGKTTSIGITSIAETSSTTRKVSVTEEEGSRKASDGARAIGNVENFALLILDRHSAKGESNRALIRRTINFVEMFDNANECYLCIENLATEQVCLILSDSFGESFMQRIQDLPQLKLVYILCETNKKHYSWAENQPKIQLLSTDLNEIIAQLQSQVEQLESQLLTWTISPPPESPPNIEFSYAQLLHQFILDSENTTHAKSEMVNYCKEQYTGNAAQLKLIDEFDRSFDPAKAVWWFTRKSCFLSRMTTRGLRSPEPDILYQLRFFVQQIHQHLLSEPNPSSVNSTFFYRRHLMSPKDLEKLAASHGSLLCFSNFLLTTTDPSTMGRLTKSNNNTSTVPVLFRIAVDPKTKFNAFANIDPLCHSPTGSNAILFSMNVVFRINSVKVDAKNVHTVDLSIVMEDDKHLRAAIHFLDRRVIDGPPLVRLTDLMAETGEYFRADQFADMIMADKSANNDLALTKLSKIYHALGTTLYKALKFDDALRVLKKSLAIQLLLKPADHITLSPTYNNMGSIYLKQRKYDQAVENHKKALDLQVKSANPDPDSVAAYLDNIASVYMEQKRYREALPHLKKALTVHEKMMGVHHKNLAPKYHQIGGLHWKLQEFQQALDCYQKTLKIQLATLPEDDSTIAATYYNQATAYEGLGELENALECAKKSVTQILKTLPATHSNSQENIAFVDRLEKKIWLKKEFAN